MLFLFAMAPGCTKEKNEVPYSAVKDIPAYLLTGGEFYGIWNIDILELEEGRHYNKDGKLYLAFTNDGKVIIENNAGLPQTGTASWHTRSGTKTFVLEGLSTREGSATTIDLLSRIATLTINKEEQWEAHYSSNRMIFRRIKPSLPVAAIWASKSGTAAY